MKNILNDIEVSRTEPLCGAVTGDTERYGYFVAAQKAGEGLYSITYGNSTIVMDSGWYAPLPNGSGGLEKIELLEEMDFYGYSYGGRVQDKYLFHGWACSSATITDSACCIEPQNGDGTRSMTLFRGPSTGSSNGIKTFGGSNWMYYYDFKEYGGNRGYVSEPVPGVAYNKPDVYYNNPAGIYPYTISLKYIEFSNTVDESEAELPGDNSSTFDEHLFSDSTPVTSFTATYEYLCKEMFYGIGDISDENLGNDSYFVVFDSNGKKIYNAGEGKITNLYNVPSGVKGIVVVFVKSTYSGELA